MPARHEVSVRQDSPRLTVVPQTATRALAYLGLLISAVKPMPRRFAGGGCMSSRIAKSMAAIASQVTEAFVQALVERSPSLAPLLEEHLRDNFGELLPHIFLGDVVRWVLTLMATARAEGSLTAQRELREFLCRLEDTYASGNEELQELLSMSFLENLPRSGEDGAEIRNQLGPTLTKQLRVIG